MVDYQQFLKKKQLLDPETGIEPSVMPDFMMAHQRDITKWALRRGRSAIFAGTGLGKTLMELIWAKEVSSFTSKPVLIFAPLAVSAQHIREANKFGLQAQLVKHQGDVTSSVVVTNYQKMDHFDLSAFGGVVLDESSILKSYDGHYRSRLIEKCAQIPFRLAATATPAPNDYMELGNHSEFLGVMSYKDMLSTFFTHDGSDTKQWLLKGHAQNVFWKWMASWSVMLRQPSDLGYSNKGFDLPPLNQYQHKANVNYSPSLETGFLFPLEARSLKERLAARRDTIEERISLLMQIISPHEPWIIWCNLNKEQDEIEKVFGNRCLSVRGSNSDDENERRTGAWLDGDRPIIISKPSMLGFGLNFQHCANMAFVGLNDSFEQVYQAIRRCWRFGQTKSVNVHFIVAETEGAVISNLRRKEAAAERMVAVMILHMADLSSKNVRKAVRDKPDYDPQMPMIIPQWIMEPRT